MMTPTAGNGSGSLLDFFTVGARAWVDSQNPGRQYVNSPTPYTQDGPAGQSQATSYYDVLRNPVVIVAGAAAAVVLVILVAKAVK